MRDGAKATILAAVQLGDAAKCFRVRPTGQGLLAKYQKKPKLQIAITIDKPNCRKNRLSFDPRSHLPETWLKRRFRSRNRLSAPALSL